MSKKMGRFRSGFARSVLGIGPSLGELQQDIPDFVFENDSTCISLNKFVQDHPMIKVPTWGRNHIEYYITGSSISGSSELIVFSVHAFISKNRVRIPIPYFVKLDKNQCWYPQNRLPLFNITNGLKSDGMIIRTSYDLGYKVKKKPDN